MKLISGVCWSEASPTLTASERETVIAQPARGVEPLRAVEQEVISPETSPFIGENDVPFHLPTFSARQY
jgi:hypothetical protein